MQIVEGEQAGSVPMRAHEPRQSARALLSTSLNRDDDGVFRLTVVETWKELECSGVEFVVPNLTEELQDINAKLRQEERLTGRNYRSPKNDGLSPSPRLGASPPPLPLGLPCTSHSFNSSPAGDGPIVVPLSSSTTSVFDCPFSS